MNFQGTSCCRICLKSELLMSFYIYSPTFPMRPIEIIEKLNIFKYDETLPTLLCQSCFYRLLDAYNLQQLAEASERRLRDYMSSGCSDAGGDGVAGDSGLGLCGISNNSIDQETSSSSTTVMGDVVVRKDAGSTATIYGNICEMFERSDDMTTNPVVPIADRGGGMAAVVGGDDMLNDIEIDVSSLTRSEANEDTFNEVLATKHTNFDFDRLANIGLTAAATIDELPPTSDEVVARPDEKFGKKHSECGKEFENSFSLQAQMRSPASEKQFRCKQCPRQFKQSSNLLIHQRTHTGERRFQCEICANFFTTSSNLKSHKTIHLEQRDFRCTQCERDFKTLRELRRHEPIHKATKDNICEMCQKAFAKRSYLREHIVVMHRCVRRYECTNCGKLFGRRSNWISHLRVHSGEKPFQCKLCPWKFNQSSALARHMKKHSKSKNLMNFELKAVTNNKVLKNTSLLNILQRSDLAVIESQTDAPDVSSAINNITRQTSRFNVLNNMTSSLVSESMQQCMNAGAADCLNEAATYEKETLESNVEAADYDFSNERILDFSTSQQVC